MRLPEQLEGLDGLHGAGRGVDHGGAGLMSGPKLEEGDSAEVAAAGAASEKG